MNKFRSSLTAAAIACALLAAAHAAGKRETTPKAPVVQGDVTADVNADKVKIQIQTIPTMKPPFKAEVSWGHKKLGFIEGARKPLILERPRDSGPMDITIRAVGFIPVHTRTHTFSDNKMNVKLTPLAQKNTLFGFRQDAPDAGSTGVGPDAGAAPVPPPTP